MKKVVWLYLVLASLIVVRTPKASLAYDVQTILDDWAQKDKIEFIRKYGIIDTTALIMCMDAFEMNKSGKSSALTDNYEHKLEWVNRIRDMLTERVRKGGNDLTHQSAVVVDNAIERANEFMCPPFY